MSEYLLPLFVGHPFGAPGVAEFRSAVELACEAANGTAALPRRYVWLPRFLEKVDHGNLISVFATVRQAIRETALAVFEISDPACRNVFLELGTAVGMNRPIALMHRQPLAPPSDLAGLRCIVYSDKLDLANQLHALLMARLAELGEPPTDGRELIHQKMQIDAIWEHGIRTADKALFFFAGDVSWARRYQELLRDAVVRGVTTRVCCRRPDEDEKVKWDNIEKLHSTGTSVRMLPCAIDPRVRGFISEPRELDEQTQVVLVEKRTRDGGRYDYVRTGLTKGESQFFYTARLYRGHAHPRVTAAMVRLFEATWSHCEAMPYVRACRSA